MADGVVADCVWNCIDIARRGDAHDDTLRHDAYIQSYVAAVAAGATKGHVVCNGLTCYLTNAQREALRVHADLASVAIARTSAIHDAIRCIADALHKDPSPSQRLDMFITKAREYVDPGDTGDLGGLVSDIGGMIERVRLIGGNQAPLEHCVSVLHDILNTVADVREMAEDHTIGSALHTTDVACATDTRLVQLIRILGSM
jgi:hypothetical protein